MNQIPIIQGATLTATMATFYTVPTNDVQLKSMKLTSMRLLNHDTVSRTVTVHIVPPGSSATSANARFKTMTITPISTGDAPAYFNMDDVMFPGTTIQATASAASVVTISANATSFP